MELKVSQIKDMLSYVCDRIIENQEFLCKLDSFVGDGDHGVTMSRGFSKVKEALTEGSFSNASDLFEEAGKVLMANMGGAIGPIYGTILRSFAKASKDSDSIGLDTFCEMFKQALDKLKVFADVKEGQKTLVDTLSPTVDALIEANKYNMSLSNAFISAEEAAKKGMLLTIDMIATKGRAKFLGERSRGFQDAGASGMYIFIDAMREFICRL